ncbi:MAG: segregation/condensation protein A [Clostridia bacterium]|nr:segregation/condensation protein A [Clostridia bacterium]
MESLSLKIEHFEGPLDLLLSLIAKNKIDIFDIPIAEIADQYMAYIEGMRSLNMEVTSDFIRMAAELMLIKSRMLLPKAPEAEDPRKELVDTLLEYKRAKELAAFLRLQSETYYDRFTKAPDEGDGIYSREHAVELLTEAFERIKLRRAAKPDAPVELFEKMEKERYYTVSEKIMAVIRFMLTKEKKGEEAEFTELFQTCRSRNEIVAVFLALLELVKSGRIDVRKTRNELYLILCKTHTEGNK